MVHMEHVIKNFCLIFDLGEDDGKVAIPLDNVIDDVFIGSRKTITDVTEDMIITDGIALVIKYGRLIDISNFLPYNCRYKMLYDLIEHYPPIAIKYDVVFDDDYLIRTHIVYLPFLSDGNKNLYQGIKVDDNYNMLFFIIKDDHEALKLCDSFLENEYTVFKSSIPFISFNIKGTKLNCPNHISDIKL